ncbi:MAG: DUF1674 domain-containing protein [Pseudomonadota bacterium]
MTDISDEKDAGPVDQIATPLADGDLPPAAQRALAEAEERRRKEKPVEMPKELGGRGGAEPTRYGDWEKDGIAHDF